MYILKGAKVRDGIRLELDNPQGPLEFCSNKPLRSYDVPNIIGISNKRLDTLIHQRLVSLAISAKDLQPEARGFLHWLKWMDEQGVTSPFESTISLLVHPTYGYKHYLIKQTKKEDGLADSTASNYLGVVRRFYVWLGNIGEVDSTEFVKPKKSFANGQSVESSDLTIRVSNKQGRSLKPLRKFEQQVFREELLHKPERFQLMMRVMRDCGFRLDECLTLPSHLFRDETLAYTTGLLVKGINIGPSVGVHTKFDKTREFFCTVTLYEAFLDYLLSDDYEKRLRKYRTKYGDRIANEPVFITRDGDPFTSTAFYTDWYEFRAKIRRRLGTDSFKHKPHDLRATFGTNWLAAALDAGYPANKAVAGLKKVMGHESETTSMKYVEFYDEDDMADTVAGFMDDFTAKATLEYEWEEG